MRHGGEYSLEIIKIRREHIFLCHKKIIKNFKFCVVSFSYLTNIVTSIITINIILTNVQSIINN